MKVKLLCDKDKIALYKKKLLDEGLEFTDSNPDLIILDPTYKKTEILGKNSVGEFEILRYSDILYVESFGHDVVVHTIKGDLGIKEKLYEIEGLFQPYGFIRIHRSYVINKAFIKTIKPTFNTKFIITMKNDDVIEVSRSYYYIFKNNIGL